MKQTGLNKTGLNQTGLNQTGLNQTGLNQTGLNQTGLNQTGLNRTGLNRNVEPSLADSRANSSTAAGDHALGLIALIPFRSDNPALLAVEAMQSGATMIELTASDYVEAYHALDEGLSDEALLDEGLLDEGLLDEALLNEGLVATIVAEVVSKTGLPVITSGLDDILLRCAFESGAIGVWSTPESGSATSIAAVFAGEVILSLDADSLSQMEIAAVSKNLGIEAGSIAIDPGPLDPAEPVTLASNLDRVSSLSASGEHVVATILGTTDAEVSIMASLAITRGARTLRTSRVTPASRAALVTDAIRRSL